MQARQGHRMKRETARYFSQMRDKTVVMFSRIKVMNVDIFLY